jgi:hypothetical protein
MKEEVEEGEAAKVKQFGSSGGWLHCFEKQ